MSTMLRRALTNAVRAYEDEARRRRMSIIGGAQAMEAEARLIRANMDALADVDSAKEPATCIACSRPALVAMLCTDCNTEPSP